MHISWFDTLTQQPKQPCLALPWSWICNMNWYCLTQLFVLNFQIMAAEVYCQAIGTLQSHSYLNNFNHHLKFQSNLVRIVTKDFSSSNSVLSRGSIHSGQRNCSVIRSSASQTSVVDPVSSPSRSKTGDTNKKSSKTNSPVNWHLLFT